MVQPTAVLDALRRHLLVDGYDLVLDVDGSRGSWLVDARDGTRYLDLFTSFASLPLGMNPPALTGDAAFLRDLALVAVNKPANSDLYTTYLAAFTDTFARVLGDPTLPYLFFIEGGAAAVENALKTAFDWKSRHNEVAGRDPALGSRVLHLTGAFHGRTGYTMSLTNTDPNKVARFPKFDWPRIEAPALRFPLEAHLAEVEQSEVRALDQARAAFAAHPHDIACFIAEPIQGEGGDRHLRPEFLQAMQALCRQHDALFVLDEVQTGSGLTGTPWAYQQLGLAPDVVAFGKKTQVCGIMAGGRLDEVSDHVFRVSSRLNSTWGGNLTDMVRSRRILEVIEAEGLIDAAAIKGKRLLEGLEALASVHPRMDNARGRGLMCAFDLPDTATRDAVVERLRVTERVLILPSGERSVRFRPSLAVTEEDLRLGCAALDRVLHRLEESS
ncbi:MAG: L-lysine 6-transaminase [Nitriliruptorales bacterium]|nr:L-lysine 6-transaminase [Nitriliruptorales bacterium]